jgi:hypothetical protein
MMLSKNQKILISIAVLLALVVLDCVFSVDGKPYITLAILSWAIIIPLGVMVYGPFAMVISDLPVMPKIGFISVFLLLSLMFYTGIRFKKNIYGKALTVVGVLFWLYVSMLSIGIEMHEL